MFDPSRHYLKLQGKVYLPVAARIAWMREENPRWSIVTEAVLIDHERQFAMFRATISDEQGNIIATATGTESVRDFADWTEKSETKAVGRALAFAGFGTLAAGELHEGHRPADSPQSPPPPRQNIAIAPAPPAPPVPAGFTREDLAKAKREWIDLCGEASIDDPRARGELLNVLLGRPRDSNEPVATPVLFYQACTALNAEGIPVGFFNVAPETETGDEPGAMFGPDEGVMPKPAANTSAIAAGL